MCGLVLIAASSEFTWNAPPVAGQAKEPVKIGVLLTLTTALAFYGTPQLEAVKMATEEANAQGGINGRPIELIVEDSSNSNTVAVNALNKVLLSKPVSFIGPIMGTQNLALLPTVNKEKLPILVVSGTRRITQQGSPYLFRFTGHDAVGKEAWTRFVVETLGKKRIGILHVANEWGYSGRDETTRFLDALYKMKPVSIASYQMTDKDLTGQLVQMQKDSVDIIMSQGHPGDETLISKQMRQLNIQIPRIGSGSFSIAFARDIVEPKEAEGMYAEAPDIIPIFHEKPAVREWAQAFKKHMGADKPGSEPDIYSLQTYESMKTLITVMRKYGTDPEQVRKGLREIKYEGLLATYQADREGNMYHQAAIMQFGPGRTAKLVRRVVVQPQM